MSAQPIPPPRQKHDICKVPLSYFESLLRIPDCFYAALRCFGYILVSTIGMAAIKKGGLTWTKVTKSKEFGDYARCSPDWADKAIEWLIAAHLIRVEFVDGKPSQPRYRIAPDLTTETKGEKIKGKCKECQFIGMFETRFVPMPRTFFTKVAPGVEHAVFVCTAVVARHTHFWNLERGLWTEPSELCMHDFRLTGLEPGMIKNGLDEAVRLKLIKRTNCAGKPSIFESCPENWAGVEKRPLREITPPVRGAKDPAKQPSDSKAEKPAKEAETPLIESRPFRTALCPKCERIVEVEPIADDLHIPEVLPAENQAPKQPPRARAGPEKRPVTRQEAAWDVLKRWATTKTIIKP